VNASTAGRSGRIVVAGAGYAGLHVALRLTAKLRNNPVVALTLVDRHDYHQVLTELPRVAGGTRAAGAVRIPLQDMLATGWRPTGPPCCLSRQAPPSWLAPRRS
jgi:NADH dehydrogenase FAD-containing subunit